MKTSNVLAGAAVAIISVILPAGFAFAITPIPPVPHTWYVNASAAANGDATAPSTATTTIQAAINAAANGDTIMVAAGTYTENSAGPNEVNVNKSVTITGAGAATTELVVANGGTVNGFNVTANDVTIQGFDIDGPANQSYTTYAWGNNVTRGIVINNGVTNFTITNDTVQNLRNDILIDGRNTGSVTNNIIDNTKSGISVQYTDGTAYDQSTPSAAPVIVITGNKPGTFGDDWGVNYHLNGHWNGVAGDESHPLANPSGGGSPIAQSPTAAQQAALLANSVANGGWSVQDQAYVSQNRTLAIVSTTGSATNQGDPLGPLDTIQNGVNAVVASGTVSVLNGAYSGAVNVTTNGIQINGQSEAGVVVTQNAGTPFGQGITVTAADGVTLDNMTFTTPNHAPMSYAFHSYQDTNLNLNNLTFIGNGSLQTSGKGIGGVDINSTNGVMISNVNVSGYTKNGFAFTAQNISTDPITQNVALSNITSSGNAWDGIAFYTESGSNIGADIDGVTFSGTNSLTNNSQGGIYFEGDTDTNVGLGVTPRFTVAGPSSATIDLSTVAFSGNSPYDIVNYQTAPVYAIGATFDPGAITGDQMTAAQRTTENGKILDQLDNSALGLVTYYTYVNDPSQSQFEESPIYVRSNNAGDTAAVALIPAEATAAQFTFTQTDGSNVYTDVAGTEHIQAGQFPIPATGQHQYRVGVSAAAGTYTVTGQYEVSGTWYPITGTAITYSLDNPVTSFVFPNPSYDVFRPGDDPARVTVDDTNDSFSDVVFSVSGTSTTWTVQRSQCDLREAGSTVLCDISDASNWLGDLPDGTYTATAIVYNQARGNTEITSQDFTIDSSLPIVTNFQINPTETTYGSTISVSADATDAESGIQNVDFYVTAPRAGDNVCDGNGTSLVDSTVTTPTSGSTYGTTLDTSALTGTYCVNVVAENLASGHSAAQEIQVQIDNTPTVTTNSASSVGDTDATLNGTNGEIAADSTSFWWGTTPESGTPFTSAVDPSSELPSGWSHDSGLGTATADGQFNESFTTLTPGTTYYFVAWSQVGGTWYPGAVESFTTTGTAPTASVTTEPASSVDSTDATLNGENGGIASTNTSFWWGTSSATSFSPAVDPTSELPSGWSHDSGLGSATVNGSFNEPLTGLTPSTTYYFAAWSQIGGTWYPGAVSQFTTPAPTPSVTTGTATNMSASDATLNATNGPVDADAESFWVSTSPTIDTSNPNNIPSGVASTPVLPALSANGTFNDQLSLVTTSGVPSNLATIQSGTTYYYVAWVEVSGTWYPGSVESVTTTGTAPTPATPGVTTDAASSPSSSDATMNATNGGVAATGESFWVSASPIDFSNPNNIPSGVYSTPVLSGVSAGASFSDQLSLVTTAGIPSNMPAITPNTTYYYVAWSEVNGTWYNGGQQTVVTTDAAPVLSNEQLTTTPTTATITWTTDHNSTSRVVYGTVPQSMGATNTCNSTPGNVSYDCYGYSNSTDVTNSPANPDGVTSHSVTVTGLTTGTTYYFRPVSEGSPEAEGGELSGTPSTDPVATTQTVAVTENVASPITLSGTAAAGDSLSFATTTSPADGVLTGTLPDLTYTPTAGFTGSDSFDFTVTDTTTNVTSSPATITINVGAAPVVPATPVANNDSATTNMNTEVSIDVLTNDTDATGITNVSATANGGTAVIDGTEIDYTPVSDFAGNDTFTYEATGPGGTSSAATVTVTVKDTTTPVLTVNGNNPAYIETNSTYSDAGATITDTPTNNLDLDVSLDGEATTSFADFSAADLLSTSTPGTHTILYAATDGGGNIGYATRTVNVLTSPTVTLTSTSATTGTIGDNPIEVTATFSEPVSNFTTADASTTNGVVSNVQLSGTSGDYTSATFDVTPATNGAVTVEVVPGAVANLAGGTNADDEQISFTYAVPTSTSGSSNGSSGSSGGTSGGGGGGNGPISGSFGASAPVALANNGQNTGGGSIGAGGQVLGASAYNFAVNFGIGSSGEDVTQLQLILIADGYLNIPSPTGYFGALTKAAVVKYQAANGISPTSGYVGPLTRASLNKGVTPTSGNEAQSLEQELQSLEAQIAALNATTTQ